MSKLIVISMEMTSKLGVARLSFKHNSLMGSFHVSCVLFMTGVITYNSSFFLRVLNSYYPNIYLLRLSTHNINLTKVLCFYLSLGAFPLDAYNHALQVLALLQCVNIIGNHLSDLL